MQTKLTLKLKDSIISDAKFYAKSNRKSLSRLVSDYFASLPKKAKKISKEELPPLTRALHGVLKSKQLSKKDYHRYLEEKYL